MKRFFVILLVIVGLVACGGGEETAVDETTETTAEELIPVRVQLQWVAQSQFAGYYAAAAEGFYEAEGLDVTILEGSPDIVPQQVCVNGGAEFCTAWVPKALESREAGADLVNIAQIFQRSGTLEVSFKESGINSVADLRGKRVGVWGFGNEHEVFAALRRNGIDPENPEDVNILIQPFDMTMLLQGELDAAEAMIYNEYAMVLEQVNPDTGELYQPDELNVIDFNEEGTAMLQDAVWVTESWIGEAGNEAIAEQFLRATFQGWMFCRDNFDSCVQHVLDAGPTLGEGHMRWQLNEINGLIWPSPDGIGVMNPDLYAQTVAVATEAQILSVAPDEAAYRTDLAEAALQGLEGDTNGLEFEKIVVEVTPGGE